MVKPLIRLLPVLFAGLPMALCCQEKLEMIRTISWPGLGMHGVKPSLNDSCIIEYNGRQISKRNIFTGDHSVFCNPADSIVDFDIHEDAGSIAMISTASLAVYDITSKTVSARYPLQPGDKINNVVFSTSGSLICYWASNADSVAHMTVIGHKGGIGWWSDRKLLSFHGAIMNFSFIQDSLLLCSVKNDEGRYTLISWNIRTGAWQQLVSLEFEPYRFSVDPNDASAAVILHTYRSYNMEKIFSWRDNAWMVSPPLMLNADVNQYSPGIFNKRKTAINVFGGNTIQVQFFERDPVLREYKINYSILPNSAIAFSRRGSFFCLHDNSGKSHFYHVPESQLSSRRPFDLVDQKISYEPTDFYFAPKTSLVCFRNKENNLYVYDIRIRRKINEIKYGFPPTGFLLHPVNREVIFYDGESILSQDVESDARRLLIPGNFSNFSISENGKLLAYAYQLDSVIHVADYPALTNDRSILIRGAGRNGVQNIYFNPNNEGLAVVSVETVHRDSVIGRSEYNYMLYYFEHPDAPGKKIFEESGSFSKVIFSPGSSWLAASNNWSSIVQFADLTSPGKPVQSVDILQEIKTTYPEEYNSAVVKASHVSLVSDIIFFNDSVAGICLSDTVLLRYNLATHRSSLLSLGKTSVYRICYPAYGANYLMMNVSNRIIMKSKSEMASGFELFNRFLDPFEVFAFSDDKLLCMSDYGARIFNFRKLLLDSSWRTNYGVGSNYQFDRSSGVLISPDFREIKAVSLRGRGSTSLLKRGDGDHSYFYSFAAGISRKMLAVASTTSTGMGDHNVRLELKSTDPARDLNWTGDYRDATFEKLQYDTVNNQVYLFYRSAVDLFVHTIVRVSPDKPEKIVSVPLRYSTFLDCVVDNKNGKIYISVSDYLQNKLLVLNSSSFHLDTAIAVNENISAIALDYRNKRILAGTTSGMLLSFSLNNYTYLGAVSGHAGTIKKIFLPYADRMVTTGSDGAINVWWLKQLKVEGSLFLIDSADFIFINPSGYYMSTRKGVNALACKLLGHVYPIDQVDLYYNRPDLILMEADSVRNRDDAFLYKKAVEKRWKYEGMGTAPSMDYFSLPKVEILHSEEIEPVVSDDSLALSFTITDKLYKLSKMNIWVNNVPVYGVAGYSLLNENKKSIHIKTHVTLCRGENKIEVAGTNERGFESIRQIYWVDFQPHQQFATD